MPEETPAGPKPVVFELPLHVNADDIDTMGHVNNIVYLRWVQDVATAHWNASAVASRLSGASVPYVRLPERG